MTWRFRGESIAEARNGRGWSRPMLARRIGVSTEAVRDWETGRTYPKVDNLTAVINALEISPGVLWERDETG